MVRQAAGVLSYASFLFGSFNGITAVVCETLIIAIAVLAEADCNMLCTTLP